MKRVSLGIGGMQAARKHHSWSPGRGRGPLDYGTATHNRTEKSWTGWRRLLAHGSCKQCTASDGVCLIGMPGTSSHMAGQQAPKLPPFCTCLPTSTRCGRACGQLFAQKCLARPVPASPDAEVARLVSYEDRSTRTEYLVQGTHPSAAVCGCRLPLHGGANGP
ncbi:hypothetical protein HDV57DRAFT_489320 [Trichoderma longibrachiatum]